jgi:hypothetical protein
MKDPNRSKGPGPRFSTRCLPLRSPISGLEAGEPLLISGTHRQHGELERIRAEIYGRIESALGLVPTFLTRPEDAEAILRKRRCVLIQDGE